ncbi:hypothetical protein AWC23_26590 [Mycobacterium saskatchewanense]|uniref:CBM2 domain-containing protein n=1 Tax=Mycobacterium saskatchewanense TaxID=220927 RepID=A0AAJ3NLJ2_9MYCO|nr:hypothetical protein AWC23_26590 [Mycobacterium saskatchewanense]
MAAAADLVGVRSQLSAAYSASGATTGMAAAASDEVSVAIAALFGAYAEDYQALGARAEAFFDQFVQTLSASARWYEVAEAAAAERLQSLGQGAVNVVNAELFGGSGGSSGGGSTNGGGSGGAGTGGSGGSTSGGSGGTTGGGSTIGGTTPSPLSATYAVTSQWDSGFTAKYTITNSGASPVTNWQAQFDLPANESITTVWNANVAQSGTQYTLTPASYDGTIASGGSVTVGFQATQTGTYSPPTHLLLNGQPVTITDPGGTGTGGAGTGSGGIGSGGSGSGGTGSGTTSSGVYSPYVDVTLWPGPNGYNFANAATAGIKDVTLAFITADSTGSPAWGGYSAYAVSGGSQISFINNQITAMHNAGITGSISFGGAAGTDLAVYAASNHMSAAQLAQSYEQVVNAYHIYSLDYDVEGAMQSNNSALTLQSQAIAMMQQQEAANGTPVTVSYTLPVLPSGLVAGSNGGLNVLNTANANGVAVSRVNIMAMDYYDPSVTNMGTAAINAATTTHSQLLAMYPSLSSEQAWQMLGVTPLIGINDDPSEIFTLANAQQLTAFAQQNHIGELSMWELPRDLTGTLGAVDATDGSGIAQTPFAFSQIFEQIGTESQM